MAIEANEMRFIEMAVAIGAPINPREIDFGPQTSQIRVEKGTLEGELTE
jgi:hypothetical protein